MESAGSEVCADEDPSNSNSNNNSKRHKERENAALHSSLNSLRVAEEEDTATGASVNKYRAEDTEPSGCSSEPDAPPQSTAQDGSEAEDDGDQEEELTLTDHLNKRLLSSFLEKLNQTDSGLPGIQRLDCAVAREEDSNRALDEW